MRNFLKRLWQDICQTFTNPSRTQLVAFGEFFHKLSFCSTVGVFIIWGDWIGVVVLSISSTALFIYGTALIGQGG